MLKNEYLIAKIGVDTAENEPIGKSDLQSYQGGRFVVSVCHPRRESSHI